VLSGVRTPVAKNSGAEVILDFFCSHILSRFHISYKDENAIRHDTLWAISDVVEVTAWLSQYQKKIQVNYFENVKIDIPSSIPFKYMTAQLQCWAPYLISSFQHSIPVNLLCPFSDAGSNRIKFAWLRLSLRRHPGLVSSYSLVSSDVGSGGSGSSMNRGPRTPGAPSSGPTENF